MTTTFETVPKRQRGYDRDQVDAFFDRAREAYDEASGSVTAEDVRATAFDMVRQGYATVQVDAALDRLEDAFAARERDRVIDERGADFWRDQAKEQAQVIVDRLLRERGRRFQRVGLFGVGYSRKQVDALADRIVAFFREGVPLEVDEVRGALFVRQGNGYSEAQVDAVLDRTVEVMLAIA
ncbi:DivIVA domain-containing protein [Pseudoclavibacter soli]|uniref:DivIVA domain-containing protein n=1 Tax=Pseudoclavibacter soli TaxID=452623 RepID=UPI00040D438E|nr:DivIVA domain-containing protein [Pseudoclavibacter soli]